nr:hypothetical protein [Actinomycetota bacterium]
QQYGPYTWDQLAEHASGGRIGRADKILDPRTGAWAKSSKVPGLFGSGGVAAAPVGLTAAAKAIAFVTIMLVLVAGGAAVFQYSIPGGYFYEFYKDPPTGEGDLVAGVTEFVERDDLTPMATAAAIPPEGLTFRGTFDYENTERDAPGGVLKHSDPCWLWIYTTDEGTAADFDFNTVDGWPVYLVSSSGGHYVFESSVRSLVERVRVVVNVTSTGMRGSVTNINNVSSFKSGTFTGEVITYEEYKAEAP